jgi:hypothetical protein
MSSSSSLSSSVATVLSNAPLSEKTVSDPTAAVQLLPGHTVEFGTSKIYSARVQEIQHLCYFGNGVGHAPGAEEVPEPEGELVVFEAFSLPDFVCPRTGSSANAERMVALAKFVWG